MVQRITVKQSCHRSMSPKWEHYEGNVIGLLGRVCNYSKTILHMSSLYRRSIWMFLHIAQLYIFSHCFTNGPDNKTGRREPGLTFDLFIQITDRPTLRMTKRRQSSKGDSKTKHVKPVSRFLREGKCERGFGQQ